jgi:hypothetical protein
LTAVSDTVTSIAEKARYNEEKFFTRRYYSFRVIVSGAKEADPASFAPYPDNPRKKEWKTIPDAALRNFPPIPAILKKGRTVGLEEHHIHLNNK